MYGDMEWIEKLLIAIAGIVTAVGGFTTIRFFFTRKEEKTQGRGGGLRRCVGCLAQAI